MDSSTVWLFVTAVGVVIGMMLLFISDRWGK